MKWEITNLIYPDRCAACGELLLTGGNFCSECEATLEFINLRQYKNKENRFDALLSVFNYSGAARDMIIGYKFKGKKYLSNLISKYLADGFDTSFSEVTVDCVTYVPMTAKEYMKRGFNQSKYLAQKFAKRKGLDCKKIIRKIRSTKNQSTLTPKDRAKNLKGCFEFMGKDLKGKTVLLVDDVKTTGATLNECCTVLRKSGVKHIYCITVASASKN